MTASSSGAGVGRARRDGAQRATAAKNVSAPGASQRPSGILGRRHGGEQIVELQTVLIEHELRLEPREDIVELVAVHLDVDGADGRAIGHHAEIAEQMLDRVVGEQRDAVVASDARVAQERGDAAR